MDSRRKWCRHEYIDSTKNNGKDTLNPIKSGVRFDRVLQQRLRESNVTVPTAGRKMLDATSPHGNATKNSVCRLPPEWLR